MKFDRKDPPLYRMMNHYFPNYEVALRLLQIPINFAVFSPSTLRLELKIMLSDMPNHLYMHLIIEILRSAIES